MGQGINPIVQIMMKKHEQQQEALRLKAQMQQHQDMMAQESRKTDIQALQQKQEQQRIENEHEYQKSLVENATDLLHAHLAQAKNEALDSARKFIAAGGSPGAYQQNAQTVPGDITQGGGLPLKSATPAGQMDIPGYGLAPVSAFKTKEQIEAENIKNQAAQAGAVQSAVNSANAPVRKEDFENKKQLQDWENQFRQKMEEAGNASREKIASFETDERKYATNVQAATARDTKAMQYQPSADAMNAVVTAGLTGQAKLDLKNPVERAAAAAIQAQGGHAIDPQDIKDLKGMNAVAPLFQQLTDFANKYLPDENGPGGSTMAEAAALKNRAMANSPFPTDIKNAMTGINSQAVNVGRSLEGMTGRPLSKQLELDVQSVMDPGITRQQAQQRIGRLQDMYVNKQENQILGGVPDAQKKLIYKATGVKPSWLVVAPKINPTDPTSGLDEPTSLQVGHAVYKKGSLSTPGATGAVPVAPPPQVPPPAPQQPIQQQQPQQE